MPSRPESVGLPRAVRLRFLIVACLLRVAEAWAALFRASVRGSAFGGRTYRVCMASQEFGFDGPFDYPTIAEQPPEESYPWQLGVSKGLVMLALRIPLVCDARWRSFAELDGIYGVLGWPEVRARASGNAPAGVGPAGAAPAGVGPAGQATEPLDWRDAAFLRLRRDGPNAHWVQRDPDDRSGAGNPDGSGTTGGAAWIVDYRELLADLPVFPGRRLEPCALRWTEAGAFADARSAVSADACGGPEIWLAGRWRTPADPDWSEARRLFHLAEVHVHETVSHLLWTHLFAESVIIAVVQNLPAGHPIREVLSPHFAFTLQANQNSGRVLLGRGGVFDRLFSSGWTGASELFVRGDQAWRYTRMVPRLDVAARGVAELPDYPWREDALLVWDVVEAHVRRSIASLDPGTTAVGPGEMEARAQAQAEARGWAAALHAIRGDRGWPACDDHETLVEIVSACAYLTVRHTHVNAQQYGMYGYPALWQASMPAGASGRLDQLPTVGQTLDTMRATFAFSIQYNTLVSTADPEFLRALDAVGRVIAEQESRRPHPFGVGHPTRISASLNA